MKNLKIHWQKWRQRLNDTAAMVLCVRVKNYSFIMWRKVQSISDRLFHLVYIDAKRQLQWFKSLMTIESNLSVWWPHCTLNTHFSIESPWRNVRAQILPHSLPLTSSDIKCIIALTTIDEFLRRKFIESTTTSRDANWNQFCRNGLAFFFPDWLIWNCLDFECI